MVRTQKIDPHTNQMTEDSGLRKVHRALISVSDKTGIVDFAIALKGFGVEIISTGGTAKALREGGVDVLDVSDVTGFPEMMDGRVKTLHPKIHGGLLGIRDNPDHLAAMREHNIEAIDLVVINLYPFEEAIANDGVTLAEAIEQIDIGGPAMIRSAAKNFRDVVVVISPNDYDEVISEMQSHEGATTLDLRLSLAARAFYRTSGYDGRIFRYLASNTRGPVFGRTTAPDVTAPSRTEWALRLRKDTELRYGENPHQEAWLSPLNEAGIANAELLSGKEVSFNNYVDADAAWQLVCDFDGNACAIIKHTNPAGTAIGSTVEDAYRRALACDPISAFGGIVAFNVTVDEAAARAVVEIFVEVVVAPDFEEQAIEVLKSKKNLRVLRAGEPRPADGFEYKHISGGMLMQTRDTHQMNQEDLKVVTSRKPSDKEIQDLLFAWTVCKHTKSNAIVYARDKQTVGVGAGQMSRVDSVKIGAMRAQLPVNGSVLASDAFFPFRDGLDEAAKHGITAVIQPGGS